MTTPASIDALIDQRNLGHATIQTTLAIYGHASPHDRMRSAERMDAILGG